MNLIRSMDTIKKAKFNLQPEHLANDLIRLQPIGTNDFEELYTVASDPFIWEQHPESNRYQQEVFQIFFDEAIKSGGAFLITENQTNKIIGSTRFYNYDEHKDTIAIGYTFLARQFWGGWYNKALKELMLNYAFQYVNKVVFHIGANNIRSQKAILKLGAKKVNEMIPDSEKELHHEYIITKNEYGI